MKITLTSKDVEWVLFGLWDPGQVLGSYEAGGQ